MSDLVNEALKDIQDGAKLVEHIPSPGIVGLISGYNELAKANPGLPAISISATTGGEFKSALAQVATKELVGLLHKYLGAMEAAPVDPVEAKKLRDTLVRVAIFSLAPIPPLYVGVMLAIGYKTGSIPANPLFNGLVSTATEILKLLLGS